MTPLPTAIAVAPDMVRETVEVWIENEPVQQFAINGEKIIFENAPRDGQKIKVRYHVEADRVTEYQIPALDLEDVESLQLVDLDNFESIEATLQDGTLAIDPAAILPGRKALATYFIKPPTTPLVLRFDDAIAAGTVQISSSNAACSDTADIQEHAINFGCAASEIEQIEIAYEKIVEQKNSFEIVTPFGTDHTEWIVQVDGKETTAFTVTGNIVTADPSVLDPQSQVQILVRWREPS